MWTYQSIMLQIQRNTGRGELDRIAYVWWGEREELIPDDKVLEKVYEQHTQGHHRRCTVGEFTGRSEEKTDWWWTDAVVKTQYVIPFSFSRLCTVCLSVYLSFWSSLHVILSHQLHLPLTSHSLLSSHPLCMWSLLMQCISSKVTINRLSRKFDPVSKSWNVHVFRICMHCSYL